MKNPMQLTSFLHPEQVADTILMLWRTGARHPLLGRHAQELHLGITLEVFNEAADIAWSRLTPEERRLAAGEADDAAG